MSRRTLLLPALALLLAACGGDDGDVADDRAAQVAEAAEEAGLPDDVVRVLELAARGATATFQVRYAGTDGAGLVVSQAPPNRRIDVIEADEIVESRVLRGGVGYVCTRPAPADPLDCERGASDLDEPGTFTDEAIEAFADELAASDSELELTVEERTIAETEATCLVTTPKAGAVLDGSGPGTDTLCLSPEGAQLLVDSGGERVVADQYTTDVPGGTFDI